MTEQTRAHPRRPRVRFGTRAWLGAATALGVALATPAVTGLASAAQSPSAVGAAGAVQKTAAAKVRTWWRGAQSLFPDEPKGRTMSPRPVEVP